MMRALDVSAPLASYKRTENGGWEMNVKLIGRCSLSEQELLSVREAMSKVVEELERWRREGQ
jgi:hypothetical protein